MRVQSSLLAVQSPRASRIDGCRAGSLEVRLAESAEEVVAAQALRHDVFRQDQQWLGEGADSAGLDFDAYDSCCQHLIVLDHSDGRERIVGTYRLIDQVAADQRGGFYSESEYDLSALFARVGPRRGSLLELGRSCVAPAYRNSLAITLLWRGIAAYCEEASIDYLFGCASFPGTCERAISGELGLLDRRYRSDIAVKALPDRYVPMAGPAPRDSDDQRLWRALPPLIRGYLQVGARVGDGAVIDHDFNTVDVFVILDTSSIRERYRRRFL